ncbi:MAG TPA: hypothetical protein VGI12_14180 [Vicinamibacterales bacterium]
MNEDAVRQFVRETIARLDARAAQPAAAGAGLVDPASLASNFKYSLAPSADGSCIIEPSVRCTHCGYCLSHGH